MVCTLTTCRIRHLGPNCGKCSHDCIQPRIWIKSTTGILQLCAAMLLIPALDVFAKLLGQTLDPVEVTFMRFVVQTMLMAPLVIWARQWHVPDGTLGMQFARGVLLAIATVCFFAALQHLPMAEAISIYFIQPLILNSLIGSFPWRTDSPAPHYCHYYWFAWRCYHFTA